MNIVELRERVRSGEISAVEGIEETFRVIEEREPEVRAFLSLDREGAVARGKELDERRSKGEKPGPLWGIPVAVKDNICVEGQPTTCASRILEGFRPPYDAHVIEHLREAGAVIVGKTNLDEFAMGSSTEQSGYRKTANPWDPGRVPGGSSGGSAAAVAAGMVDLSLGSDTGGSVRQPAAFCGVVGFKPTYGLVSRYGLVAFASSLDQIGPITRDVAGAALLLDVIAAPDRRDSTCVDRPRPSYGEALGRGVKGLTIGLPKECFPPELDDEMESAVRGAVEALEKEGAKVREISLPSLPHGIPTYCLVAMSEASSNLARYDGTHFSKRVESDDWNDMFRRTRGEGFGPEVKRRIILGTFALSSGYYDAYYLKAQKVRSLIQREYLEAFKEVDVIAGPTTPTPAFRMGEKTSDPLQMYLSDLYTVSANLAGIPAVSVPCGLSNEGLPLGIQFSGKPFDEETLLAVSAAHEKLSGVLEKKY